MRRISKLMVIGLALVLGSCGSTRQLTITAVEPARVDLSKQVLRVGVLNSAEPQWAPQQAKDIEGLVAIEDQWLVEQAQKAALEALVSELRADNRFEVELLDNSKNGFKNGLNESESTSWDELQRLCGQYAIDALFSLTHFDAETEVSLRKTKMEQLNMMREKENVPAQEITLETLVQNSWKIYDPAQGKIVDEYSYDQQLITKAKGIDPIAALRAIGSRKDSLLSAGKRVGNSYGERLKPYERQIQRAYFVKGTAKLVEAGEIMALGDVDRATALWRQEVDHSNKKIKGRACHNIAVGLELEGNLNEAHQWAVKAHENLKDKASRTYLTELGDRLDRQPLVAAQLAELGFEE